MIHNEKKAEKELKKDETNSKVHLNEKRVDDSLKNPGEISVVVFLLFIYFLVSYLSKSLEFVKTIRNLPIRTNKNISFEILRKSFIFNLLMFGKKSA